MRETAADLAELQDLLDRSYASAGEHLLSIHTPNWRVPASELVEILTGMCVLNLATVNSKGEPFVGAVHGLFFRECFYCGSSYDSLRAKHIARNPAVSAAHTRGEELSVVVHGTAVQLDTGTELGRGYREFAIALYGEKMVDDFLATSPYWRIEPKRMFALRPAVGEP